MGRNKKRGEIIHDLRIALGETSMANRYWARRAGQITAPYSSRDFQLEPSQVICSQEIDEINRNGLNNFMVMEF
jgi:hypothetical protein